MASTTDQRVTVEDFSRSRYCIGVDVGGTFTDVVLSDGVQAWRAKAPSTHGRIGDGVIDGCEMVAAKFGLSLPELLPLVDRFGLGTTAVTNVIAARVGRKVGLITTIGFEDLLPIAKVRRIPRDGWLVPPDSLVPRSSIRGISERIDSNGQVLVALDAAEAVAAARYLLDERGVEELVVSFLWGCINPVHEAAAVAAISEAFPAVRTISAARLLPVVREYERTTFAVLNAYTATALDGVDELVERLKGFGLAVPPLLVHSGGGSISVHEGRETPAILAESGPAAGVVGAIAVCEAAGVTDAVACDMGGTSFDMSLIRDGQPIRRTRGELMGVWTALPMVDIESASAGGGSIGWADEMGFLRVGPRSAGANPGPACYGRGGTQPTVTDALVVLGYIAPERFLGGAMQLDRDAAMQACARLGDAIGSDAIRAAWGIREVALAEMARALRKEFARKGVDQREFAIVSLGGCGGLFNPSIARELGIRKVLVPELTSVLSAFGAASANVRRERCRALSAMMPADQATLEIAAIEMREAILSDLAADGISPSSCEVHFEVDLRFMRQQWELSMTAEGGFDPASQQRIVDRFVEEYASRYGRGALMSGAPVELVTLRAIGLGETTRPNLVEYESQPSPQPCGSRPVWIEREGEMTAAPFAQYDERAMVPGAIIVGPAIIDASDTTLCIPDGCTARVDRNATVTIEVGP